MIPTKKILSFFLVILGAVTLSGCAFKEKSPEVYQVDLEVWGVFDDTDAYAEILNQYRGINPYVRDIQYRKMPVETYKEDLLNALAAGKGPDVFMIRNSWRSSFEDKVAPAPDHLLTEREYREALVDVAGSDFIGSENKIYGMPLSVDSLALYYNKDLLNAAGVSKAPETWEDLVEVVQQLNQIDQFGNITQSGVALGTALNINRSTDILTVLMAQNGADINDALQEKRINLSDEASRNALDFYSQFASIGSPLYSWNPRQHYSIDAFYEGTLAMMINYSWQYETIKQKNAKLNIGTVLLPQFRGKTPTNLANYWGFVVAKNTPTPDPIEGAVAPKETVDPEKENYLRVHESWQLLKYLGLEPKDKQVTLMNGVAGTTKVFPVAYDPTEKYLEKTKKPAARRDLIEKQKSHVTLGAFALGNLIAKNPYQGNPEAIEGILADVIESVSRGEKTSSDALSSATQRINLLMR